MGKKSNGECRRGKKKRRREVLKAVANKNEKVKEEKRWHSKDNGQRK